MIEAIRLSYGAIFKLGDEDFVEGVTEVVDLFIEDDNIRLYIQT